MKSGHVVKRRFFLYNNSDLREGKLILDNPILCFNEKDPCPDVKRKDLNEIDCSHFKGFANQIYWTEEA